MNSYREPAAWQRGMDIAKSIYQVTRQFPRVEQFGLISQMQRAAVSIPADIAEGHARDSTKEFLRHLARDFSYLDADGYTYLMATLDETSRMLRGLQHSLRRKLSNSAP